MLPAFRKLARRRNPSSRTAVRRYLFERLELRITPTVTPLPPVTAGDPAINGLDYGDNSVPNAPPDTDLAAGDDYVGETSNGVLSFYDKATGAPVEITVNGSALPASVVRSDQAVDLSGFFQDASVNPAHPLNLNKVTDPVITFDGTHFVIACLDNNYQGDNGFDFAVSDAETPGAPINFTYIPGDMTNNRMQRIPMGAPGTDLADPMLGSAVSYWPDYTKIGWNDTAYVISFMMFREPDPSGGDPDASGKENDHSDTVVISKNNPNTYKVSVIDTPNNNDPEQPGTSHFVAVPAVMDGDTTGTDGDSYMWLTEDDILSDPDTSRGWHDSLPGMSGTLSDLNATSGLASVSRSDGSVDVFGVDTSGNVEWGSGTGANTATADMTWQALGAPNGVALPSGTPVTAISRDSTHIDLFLVGADGGTYYMECTGSSPGIWVFTGGVAYDKGERIAAVSRDPTHIDLLGTSTYYSGTAFWGEFDASGSTPSITWNFVGTGGTTFATGTGLAAVERTADNIDMLGVGTDGVLYDFSWAVSSPGSTTPKAVSPNLLPSGTGGQVATHVTAVTRPDPDGGVDPGYIDAFAVDAAGQIHHYEFDGGTEYNPGWQPDSVLSGAVATVVFSPGAVVAAAARNATSVDIVAVGLNHSELYSTHFDESSGWTPLAQTSNGYISSTATPSLVVTDFPNVVVNNNYVGFNLSAFAVNYFGTSDRWWWALPVEYPYDDPSGAAGDPQGSGKDTLETISMKIDPSTLVASYTDYPIALPSDDTFYSPPAQFAAYDPGAPEDTQYLTALDSRIVDAKWRTVNGTGILLAAQTAALSSTADVADGRVYQFTTSLTGITGVTKYELDSGEVSTFFPSVAIAADGSIGITFMLSAVTTDYKQMLSMWVTGVSNGEVQPPVPISSISPLLQPGTLGAGGEGDPPTPLRVGDFSGIMVDPAPEGGVTSFWAANEVANGAPGWNVGGIWANWQTMITRFTINSSPGTPSGATSTTAAQSSDATVSGGADTGWGIDELLAAVNAVPWTGAFSPDSHQGADPGGVWDAYYAYLGDSTDEAD